MNEFKRSLYTRMADAEGAPPRSARLNFSEAGKLLAFENRFFRAEAFGEFAFIKRQALFSVGDFRSSRDPRIDDSTDNKFAVVLTMQLCREAVEEFSGVEGRGGDFYLRDFLPHPFNLSTVEFNSLIGWIGDTEGSVHREVAGLSKIIYQRIFAEPFSASVQGVKDPTVQEARRRQSRLTALAECETREVQLMQQEVDRLNAEVGAYVEEVNAAARARLEFIIEAGAVDETLLAKEWLRTSGMTLEEGLRILENARLDAIQKQEVYNLTVERHDSLLAHSAFRALQGSVTGANAFGGPGELLADNLQALNAKYNLHRDTLEDIP